MENIKLVIFDLDGTLLYTIKDIHIALNYALNNNGLDSVSLDEAKYMVGRGVNHLIDEAIKGKSEYFNQVKSDYICFYKTHNMVNTNPYQGIMHLLKLVKQAGIKLACLSNKPDGDTKAVINHYFNGLFDYVVGSKDNVPLKPNIIAANTILEYFKIDKSNVLYLGDSEIDVLTANNASLAMGACLWGYRTKQELNGADYFFNSSKEVENFILKNNDLIKSGAIIYDKPVGISSQDAILDIKHQLINNGWIIEKIGHAGTLDPFASGVLVVLINEATKLSNYLTCHDKVYEGCCKLGIKTDTYDIDGKVLKEARCSVSEEDIDRVLHTFLGKQKQVPPMYSAIKVDGKKLYDLARKGVSLDLEARDIEVYSLKRLSGLNEDNSFIFEASVSKGTYIRSLCNEIGEKLNTYGACMNLRRIKSGSFDINQAVSIDDIKKGKFKLISLEEAIDFKKIIISEDTYKKMLDGKAITRQELGDPSENIVSLIYLNKLVAIYYFDDTINRYRAKRVWN